jgi:putative addiction module component (TIGR02574 family)
MRLFVDRRVNLVPSPYWQEMTMSVSLKSLGIDRLSVADRLNLVEELWDSIAAATPLTDAQRAELDRRLADHEANPDDVVSWEEVQSSITARLNR